MAKIISHCPSCGAKLKIAALHCNQCGLELKNDFELGLFESLTQDQREFLLNFLKQRGNMSSLQQSMGISYPAAKKRLDDLLLALGLVEESERTARTEVIDVANWNIPADSRRASDMIKQKLKANGGQVVVYTLEGKPCEIYAAPDGESFTSDKLTTASSQRFYYKYVIFDMVVDLLREQGGRAKKGNGRNCKLGDFNCNEKTVAGMIGYRYFGRKAGDSIYDPVFVLAAILDWAGIATNGRGELVLNPAYCGATPSGIPAPTANW